MVMVRLCVSQGGIWDYCSLILAKDYGYRTVFVSVESIQKVVVISIKITIVLSSSLGGVGVHTQWYLDFLLALHLEITHESVWTTDCDVRDWIQVEPMKGSSQLNGLSLQSALRSCSFGFFQSSQLSVPDSGWVADIHQVWEVTGKLHSKMF